MVPVIIHFRYSGNFLRISTLPIMLAEFTPCMFVRTPCSRRHLPPVLTNSGNDVLPHLLRFSILTVTTFCLSRRSAPQRQWTRFQLVRQLITHEIDNISRFYTGAWLGSLAVDFHMAARYRGRSTPTCLIKARKPKPLIDSQSRVIWFVHFPSS